ncbi:MAG: WXG100 family type VII secretion target [Defluviitaleaceae bacterium]|nr:WXG100 family type VII secretion target [Defluviitaleaceae bacterium]
MATGTIRVTPQTMRAAADRLNGQADQWRVAVNQITQFVTEMNSMWDGLGNDSFFNVYQEDKPRFDQLQQFMQEYIAAINTAAATYDQGEQAVKGIVSRRR